MLVINIKLGLKGNKMKSITKLLFEANILKEIPRSGYHFLGAGKETIAEHSFMTAFIAYVISQMEPELDGLKLILMGLLHDLPEARTGDLNSVWKRYVEADEKSALKDLTNNIPFGKTLTSLIDEFKKQETKEAILAHDADQLSFIIDLKILIDAGYSPPEKWLPAVLKRLKTETGKKLAESITSTESDSWWWEEL